jgi:Anti-sigma-K factor rskA/Putative zinc-finger
LEIPRESCYDHGQTMSDIDRSSGTRDCSADVAAYALGALEPAEADIFRKHLDECVVCRDELLSFQQVVDALPMSAPLHRAPKGLRRRVLHAIEQEPGVTPTRDRSPRRVAHGRWRFSLPRPALAFSVLALAAAVTVTGIELNTSATTRTRVYAAQVTGAGTAEVTVTGGHAELIVHRFSPPPAGEIYEVWLVRGHRPPAPTSALFSVTARGDGDVEVPGDLRGVDTVMVTPEPAGGSRVPTHPAVIRASLT